MSLITTEMLRTNYDPKISMPMSQYVKAIVDTRNETVDNILDIIECVRQDANNGYMFDMVKEIRIRVEAFKEGGEYECGLLRGKENRGQ